MDAPPNDLDPHAFRQFLMSLWDDGGEGPESLAEARARFDRQGLAIPMPAGCVKHDVETRGVPGEQLTPEGADEGRTILYLHGGGYGLGSSRSIRHFAARLAGAAKVTALVPEYRLAPENPFPAALDDAMAAYRWLLERTPPERIAVSGDSAGGALALSLALRAKQDGLPPPVAVHAISPWADLAAHGPSYAAKLESDIFCAAPELARMRDLYLAGHDPADPLASPCRGDFTGFPPLFIQVGSEEILLSDSITLAERAAFAQVSVRLEVFPAMLHVFPIFHDRLALARRAIAQAGAWIADRLASP